jgi:DNA helicase-2/ATP-dependent DNA helicase PcrA
LIFNDFLLKFKDAKKYVLNLNYRSGQKILDAANKLIKNNGNRLEKNLKSQTGEGNHVLLYDAYDVNDEGDFISKEINYLHEKEGYEYKDFAILYRANYLSRSIETKLIDRGVPYLLYGGVKFYQRKEIKDILSYLRLLVNDDEISFKRIINVPKRGIGQTLIDRVSLYATQNNISFVNALYLKKSQDFDIT